MSRSGLLSAESTSAPTATRVKSLGGQGNGPGWIDVQGDVLFLDVANDGRVKSYDLTDPANPTFIGQVTVPVGTAAIKVRGRYLYVTNQADVSVRVIDISNPAAMSVVATLAYSSGGTGGGRFDIDARGRRLLVGGPEGGANANKAYLIDISNPLAPTLVGATGVVGSTHRGVAAIADGVFALSSRDDHTVKIIEHGPATGPQVVKSLTTTGATTTPATAQGDLLYVCDYGSPGYLHIFDCSKPTAPVLVSTTTIGFGSESVFVRGGYAYIGLRASNQWALVDVRNPAKPVLVGTFACSGTVPYAAVPAKGYLYQSVSGDSANGILDAWRVTDGALRRVAALEEILAPRLARANRPPNDNGQAGMIAPSTPMCQFGGNTPLNANRAFLVRFVPSRDMAITRISFNVTVAASVDDAIDVGIYDATLTRIASASATTGQVNSTGVKTVTLTAAVTLDAGQVYYAALSYGAVGGTGAQFSRVQFVSSEDTKLFGASVPQIDAVYKDSAHPLPASIASPSFGQNFPLLAVREA